MLASTNYQLSSDLQEVIINWCSKANTRESSAILSELAGRQDLSDTSIKQIAKNKSAKVAATMLTNPSIDKDIAKDILLKEKRVSVLAALASMTEDAFTMERLIEKQNVKILESLLTNPKLATDLHAKALAYIINFNRNIYASHAFLRAFLSENPECVAIIANYVEGSKLSMLVEVDLRYLDVKTTQRMVDELVTSGLVEIKNHQERDPHYISSNPSRLSRWSGNDLTAVLVRLTNLVNKTNINLENLKQAGIVWQEIKKLVNEDIENYISSRSYSSHRESALMGRTWLEAAAGDFDATAKVESFLEEKNKVINNSLQSKDSAVLQSIVKLIYRNDPNAGLLAENLLNNTNFTLDCLPLESSGKLHDRLLKGLLDKGNFDSVNVDAHIENYIRNTIELSILEYVPDSSRRVAILERALVDSPAWKIDSALSKNIYSEEILESLSIAKLYQVKEHGQNSMIDNCIIKKFEAFIGENPDKIKEFEGLSQDYQGSFNALIEASQKI
jgi:hypothetical protein